MHKLLFSFEKYKQWRIEHEHLDEEAINIIEAFNNYKDLDGVDYEELWKIGKIILKDWCLEI